ncbi:EAL domain-containing protein [uncultured Xanthomonas sp.]|uniref:putative bifunctional diguanylate cyclase/phosphodiesterase n=1 Tax=uncultured Xanthomonas sp. TaxID=152831 RepID=UPI0025D76C2B|nr:EAL domain-containing protein [uncultured Xanthomonas sp.]
MKSAASSEKHVSNGESWVSLKFRDSNRSRKMRSTLTLAGVSCTTLGALWTVCYLYYGRPELALAFVGLTAVGLLALCRRRHCDEASLSLVAHGVFVVVLVISFIDAPIGTVPRSVHTFFLPLVAGALFVFDRSRRYRALVFPLACLGAFVAFGSGELDWLAPASSPPLGMRRLGAISNMACAASLLAAILHIYRNDVNARISLERELARAVGNGEIEVLYQPQVSANGSMLGAEALVRWRHPSGKLLTPDKFIPLAEESQLIRDVGLEVLRQACSTLRRWSHEQDLRALVVAVNVSPVQLLDPNFVASVKQVITSEGVAPASLEFELTESALYVDTAGVRAKMHELKAFGIGWALDDFGTGFSSLAMLRTLPVTKLKIDRQFVNDAKADESSRRLLAKIVEISEVMGMVALAEGIEDAQQCEMLSAMGCRHFQGFLFGRPQPAHDLERLAFLQAGTERNLMSGAATRAPDAPPPSSAR